LDLPAGEASERSIALRLRRVAVDVLGAHSRFQEFIADMDGVPDTDRKADGAPALAVLVPVLDDVEQTSL
jgi:hypothetical protein